jgi:hypothetical protein
MATRFETLVRKELARARQLHEYPQRNLHEGYAVILEEVDELWDIVRMKRADRDPAAILTELVQIGAMAQRCAEDLALV